MVKRRPWWQWALLGLAIVLLAWANLRVWTSWPSTATMVEQAIDEVRQAIGQGER